MYLIPNPSKKKLPENKILEIIEQYSKGELSCQELAIIYGFWPQSVSRIMRRRGLKLKHRTFDFDEHYFDNIDTEAKSYFLGLLYADGCNCPDRNLITISLQEEDRHILESFKKEIKYNGELSLILPRKLSKKNQYKLQVYSSIMSNKLNELGCFPRKSLILEFPTEQQVPSYLLRHFIRGVIDGDGSICKSKNSFSVNITSTENFCKPISFIWHTKFGGNVRVYTRFPERNNSTRTISINTTTSIYGFLEWIYKDASFYLKRKYNRYLEFCEIKKEKINDFINNFSLNKYIKNGEQLL